MTANSTILPAHTSDEALIRQCIDELKQALSNQQEWVKVHAAEYLIWLGEDAHVEQIFLEEAEKFGETPPYRIGIWRVLVQATRDPMEKKIYTDKIIRAFLDTAGTDRGHAAETLGKLNIPLLPQYLIEIRKAISGPDPVLSVFTKWSATLNSSPDELKYRNALQEIVLQNQHPQKAAAAYIFRHIGLRDPDVWNKLAEVALKEKAGSGSRVNLLSSGLVTAPENMTGSQLYQNIKNELLKIKNSQKKTERAEMCAALALKGDKKDLPLLISLLNNENPIQEGNKTGTALNNTPDNTDVRCAAAYAIIKIIRR